MCNTRTQHKRISARVVLLIFALSLLPLCGCALDASVNSLYSLPVMPDEYVVLQELLDAELRAGSEYAAPTAGNLRQSVQQYDIYGDGILEALAFFRNSARTAYICVYRCGENGDYELYRTIVGDSADIGRIDYGDMDGDGVSELFVEWQLSAGMSILKGYSFSDPDGSIVLTADCATFRIIDITGSGQDLFVFSLNSESGASADMYRFSHMGAEIQGVPLSKSLVSVDRVRRGNLYGGGRGIYVEGTTASGGSITDILAIRDGELCNVTMGEYGDSVTFRSAQIYACDVTDDGIGEIPMPVTVYGAEGDSCTFTDWYDYDINGISRLSRSEYTDGDDGWRLNLSDELRYGVCVKRTRLRSGETAATFYRYSPDTGEGGELLTIYTLNGDNRFERANEDDRFILLEAKDTVYAAELTGTSLTRDEVSLNFEIICDEWVTGEM